MLSSSVNLWTITTSPFATTLIKRVSIEEMQKIWLCTHVKRRFCVCRYNAVIFCESSDIYFFSFPFHIWNTPFLHLRCREGAVWADIRIIPLSLPSCPLPITRPTTVDSVSWKTSKHQIWPFSHKASGKTLNMSGQSFRQIGQIEMFHKYLENTNLCLVSNKLNDTNT